MTTSTTFFVGPIAVEIDGDVPALVRRIDSQLRIFDRPWDTPSYTVRIRLRTSSHRAPLAESSFLDCSRMTVSGTANTLYATTLCGASGRLEERTASGETWSIDFPAEEVEELRLDEVEDLVGLALVSGWRACGWTPVHAGAAVKGDNCVVLCATSGGGKSTLTAALVRDGWRTLGDDKLLLRVNPDGTPELAALLHTFNLHPRTRAWFPEVGDLEQLPFYSAWTVKRKVRTEDIWPGQTAERARPTHVVRVQRDGLPGPIRVTRLADEELFRTLIGQVAIPNDRSVAAATMKTIALTLRSGLRGLEMTIGEGAYEQPDCLYPLDDAL